MKARILPLLLVLVSIGCASSSSSPPRLRVMTYNIHHAGGMDEKVDVARIANIINEEHPDLVAIQEVDRGCKRSGKIDEPAEFERLTHMHMVFGKAIDYDGGDYGQVILSRFPIDTSKVYPLPGTPGREKRIAVAVYTHAPFDTPLIFVGTHLEHQKQPDRVEQAKSLKETIGTFNTQNVILAGDLNATEMNEVVTMFLSDGWRNVSGLEKTSPSTQPHAKIDWVLVGPDSGWRTVKAQVLPETVASDHRPVVVDLEWKPANEGKN